MSRRLLLTLLCCAGCTPFGLWLYEEPTVALDDVLLDPGPAATALPPYVVLAVKNRNDFPVSLRRIELVLRIDGRDVGTIDVDTVVTLAPVTIQPVRVKVPPADTDAAGRVAGVRRGVHRYGVVGRARLETPIGERRVGFAHEIQGEAVAETAAPDSTGIPPGR